MRKVVTTLHPLGRRVVTTSTLPTEIKRFGHVSGVWVTDFQSAVSLIDALRMTLIQGANTKALQDGQETKMELVYEYLTGPKFKHRVEAIVEKFEDMCLDLNREKKIMLKNWAKRDSQIEGVIMATVGDNQWLVPNLRHAGREQAGSVIVYSFRAVSSRVMNSPWLMRSLTRVVLSI